MKISDIRNMSADELDVKNSELAKELFNLRFQLHTGRLENTARISSIRKDIARINTVIREIKG